MLSNDFFEKAVLQDGLFLWKIPGRIHHETLVAGKPFHRYLSAVITRFVLALLLLGSSSYRGFGQDTAARRPDPRQLFADAKTGRAFGLHGRYARMNAADSFDFSNLKRPTFVSIGFYYCGPCRAAMPHFITQARLRPQNNFVYITYDAKARVEQELTDNKESLASLPDNLSIVPMSQERQYYYALVRGYPVKYFVHSDGIVDSVQIGGPVNHLEKEVAAWIAALEVLH